MSAITFQLTVEEVQLLQRQSRVMHVCHYTPSSPRSLLQPNIYITISTTTIQAQNRISLHRFTMSFLHHRFDPFDPLFTFPSPSSFPVSSSSLYFHRESSLPSPPFHFPPLPLHAYDPLGSDLDLFNLPLSFDHPPLSSSPYYNSASVDLLGLSNRITSLELGAYRHCPTFNQEIKQTWTTKIKGERKHKWVAESKSNGKISYEYETEIKSPWEDGFERKYKWKAERDGKVKWTKVIKGKGCHEPWAHKYTCEESSYGEGWKKCNDPWDHNYTCDELMYGVGSKKCHKKDKIKEKEEKKEDRKEKKEKHSSVRVVEIEDSTSASAAIRKVQVLKCLGVGLTFLLFLIERKISHRHN